MAKSSISRKPKEATPQQAPQLGPTENQNDAKFQGVYDALEQHRKRLAAGRRQYGKIIVEIPYQDDAVQEVAVTDKRVQR